MSSAGDILFDQLVVTTTRISLIDERRGRVAVRGHDLERLKDTLSYEQMTYLLRVGRLPDAEEAAAMNASWAAAREGACKQMSSCDPQRPLDAMLAGLPSFLEVSDAEYDWSAPLTMLAATALGAHGAHQCLASDCVSSLTHAGWILATLRGTPVPAAHESALQQFFVIMAEHALNASSLVARVIASTGADDASALRGAICTLSGRLHGGALEGVIEQFDEAAKTGTLDAWCEQKILGGDKIMGFGHSLYGKIDPRAAWMAKALEKIDPGAFERANAYAAMVHEVLTRLKPGHEICTNVDFFGALLLRALSIPRDLMVSMFVSARAAGWLAHIAEQRAMQTQVGVMHPRSRYLGAMPPGWS